MQAVTYASIKSAPATPVHGASSLKAQNLHPSEYQNRSTKQAIPHDVKSLHLQAFVGVSQQSERLGTPFTQGDNLGSHMWL